MKKEIIVLIPCLILMLFTATGQTTPTIKNSQVNQHAKISNGIDNGSITPNERKQLVAQQKSIQAQKRIAKADGVVTRRERKQIKAAQKRANRNIARKKHN